MTSSANLWAVRIAGREQAITSAGEMIGRILEAFAGVSPDVLRTQRREKFLAIGRSI